MLNDASVSHPLTILTVVFVGGFLGGFATLISRMRDGHDDDWTDPGSGAVV